MKMLLIGGARSGKSALASRWANERCAEVCSLVTAIGSDPEMMARIAAHRRERPAHWRVREEPMRLGHALRQEAAAGGLILLDCLTAWISNCLWPPEPPAPPAIAGARSPPEAAATPTLDEARWKREREDFLDAVSSCNTDLIVVSNEVGTGIVPGNAVARLFRDEQGWLNQAVAGVCDEVFLVAAGLPLRLKPV
ncbi:MAG: bifunctional adenosylcobinamide kinase/adenosylcobinamide-phosphate guanylyltransferase [Steroidobacteraceae bacterium]